MTLPIFVKHWCLGLPRTEELPGEKSPETLEEWGNSAALEQSVRVIVAQGQHFVLTLLAALITGMHKPAWDV